MYTNRLQNFNRLLPFFIKGLVAATLFMLLINCPLNAANFDVTNTSGKNYGPVVPNSLHWAIAQANAAGVGPHTIRILVAGTIADSEPAPYSITNSNITIDGSLAPSFACGTPSLFFDGPAFNSFNISGNNVTLRAIGIRAFSLNVTGSNFSMYGCWLGLNNAGTALAGAAPGPPYAISITGGGATIGGNTTCDRNVFSMTGVTNELVITGNNNSIVGNYFGTNASGANRLFATNAISGSCILSQGNTTAIDQNTITGSAGGGNFAGISINGASADLVIQNNRIGLNANGVFAFSPNYGNDGHGIYTSAAITGASFIRNNIISNNRQSGISIEGSNSGLTISGNTVGLPSSGVQASTLYGNGDSGIRFFGASSSSTNLLIDNNTVCNSGLINSAGNAATSTGIIFNGAVVNSVTISNNYAGLDRSFNGAGNQFPGVYFFSCGAMGGSNAANVVVNSNVLGFNGIGVTASPTSHGFASFSSNYFTVTNNFIGIGPGGQNIGNTASGIEINTCTNFIVTNNNIQNNRGRRPTSDLCAGIVCFSSSFGTIQGNTISNNLNSVGFTTNHGIVVERQGQILIGGTAAGQPNTINGNGTHGIFVLDGANFVQMTRNIITCNASMGISLNVSGDPNTVASKSVGNNTMTSGPTLATTGCPGAATPGSGNANGTVPVANSVVEVFTTPACKSCPNALRGEASAYQQTVTASGTAWNATGVTGNVSVTATSPTGSGGYFPTSRFSDCQVCSLPIELAFFNGVYTDGKVKLTWATLQERNSGSFVIERSNDGRTFYTIGTLAATGNSDVTIQYHFFDENPLEGVAYYRLREIDATNNESSFSRIVRVVNSANATSFVYPNPAKNTLTVEVANLPTYEIELSDITGKVVINHVANSTEGMNSKVTLDISALSKGIYIAVVKGGNYSNAERVIIE